MNTKTLIQELKRDWEEFCVRVGVGELDELWLKKHDAWKFWIYRFQRIISQETKRNDKKEN